MPHLLAVLLCGCALLSVGSGCSLIVDFDECSEDSDCAAGSCNKGVCESQGCATIADCNAGDLCLRGQCHTLDNTMCTYDEDLEPETGETLHVGLLLPYTGRNAAKADATGKSSKTAFQQINFTHNGVRGVPLSVIECDTQQNSDHAAIVADYMVNTLGLQSIIGSISSGETLAVADVTIPAGTVLVTPASTSPTISTLDDNDLVWRTIASDALQGPALANIVVDGGHTKVLVLSVQSAYGQGLFNAFIGAGTVGTDQIEALNYEVDDAGDLVADSLVGAATALFVEDGYVPDAIVVMGSLESQQIIFSLDDTFFESLAEEDKPVWILSEAGRDTGLLEPRFSAIWPRIQGTIIQNPGSEVFDDFELRLKTNYGLEATEHPFADKAYDAAWLLALAHGAAANPLDTTGADVAEALARTDRESMFTPGDDLATALDALAADGIDYVGASGMVNFDPATGDVQSDISKWIINTDAATPVFETTGVVFSPAI